MIILEIIIALNIFSWLYIYTQILKFVEYELINEININ